MSLMAQMVGEIHSRRFRTASQHGRPQGSSDGQQHKAPGTRGPPRGHFEKSKAVALAVICDRQAERNERLTPFEPASFRLLLERRRDNTSVCSQCHQREHVAHISHCARKIGSASPI